MRPSRNGYDNIKRWKVVRRLDSYEILPSPNYVFTVLFVVLPGVAFFYWLVHFAVEVEDKKALFIADLILFGTSALLLAICFITKFQVSRDMRPFLVVKISGRELCLPRLEKSYRLDGVEKNFYFAHDYFDGENEFDLSEFNFFEQGDGEETRTLLLHFVGPWKEFDRIGEELERFEVPFESRTHKQRNGQWD